MKLNLIAAAALLALLVTGASRAADVKVTGGALVNLNVLAPNAAYFREQGVDVKFDTAENNAAMLALIEGRAQMAAIAIPLDNAIEAVKQLATGQGRPVSIPGNLRYHYVGYVGMIAVASKALPIEALSKSQLRDILTGNSTNWKDVGGPDLPIKVFMTRPGNGQRLGVELQLLDGKPLRLPGLVEVDTERQLPERMLAENGAFSIISGGTFASNPKGGLKVVRLDQTVWRPLGLVTIGEPTGDTQRIVQYLTSRAVKPRL